MMMEILNRGDRRLRRRVVQMLFPIFLLQLTYEKERRLRMMMKMHGLGDTAYWCVHSIL